MSRNPDPCYCEQATAYEDLLNKVLECAIVHKDKGVSAELRKQIEQTIGNYQTAQSDYVDDEPCFDDCGCEDKDDE